MTVYLWNENTNVKGVLNLAVATHKLYQPVFTFPPCRSLIIPR